jgi:RNA polymerase sigma-70 factor (ECF subfamily)
MQAAEVTTPMDSLDRRRLAPVGGAVARRASPIEFEPVANGAGQRAADLAQRADEKNARGVILATLEHPLRATLHRFLGSDDDFEDLLQDVWMQIFRSLASYRGEAELVAWAERVAIRTTLRYLHGKSRKMDVPHSSLSRRGGGLDSLSDADDAAAPESTADTREALRRLHAIITNLKPRYRTAFILFEFEGKSLREVAAMMDSGLPATKSRIIRARLQIAKAARADKLLRQFAATWRATNGALGTTARS